jgi:hypothetical protein
VGARLQGDSSPIVPIPASQLAFASKLTITGQPTNITVLQNHDAIFTVVATVAGAGNAQYQWQRSTDTSGTTFTNIPGATASNYILFATLADDLSQFRCEVRLIITTNLSSAAILHVVADNVPPVLLSARTDRSFTTISLNWSEVMYQPPAIEQGSYLIYDGASNQIFVASVDYARSNVVLHLVTALQPGTTYYFEIDFQADLVGNLTAKVGNPAGDPDHGIVTNIRSFVRSSGTLLFEAYNTGGGNNVSDLTGNALYPNSPDTVRFITAATSRQVYPTDTREGYGARMTGYFVPLVTSNYTFYLSSDDASELWLSTGDSEVNKVLLTAETGCCNPFSAHASASLALTAGQPYWFQLLYKEGTGGDYGQAAVKFTADPVNPDSLQPINGGLLASLADPTGASVTITQQPVNVVFLGGTGVSLASQDFNANNGGFTVTTPQPYDGPWVYNPATGSWQENGQGATDSGHPNTSLLDSPGFTVTVAGQVILSFDHRYSFEQDATSWDGGQVRVSRNGGPFTAVPGSSFTTNGYNGTVGANSSSQLSGQQAFVGTSPNFAGPFITSVVNVGSFNAGDVVRVEFFAGNDGNTTGPQTPSWEIDAVRLGQGAAQTVTFSVGATGVNSEGSNPTKSYQWYRDDGAGFVPISGANGASYTFAPQASDNGARFRAVVNIPGASATSTVATLTVSAGGPTLTLGRSAGVITLSWAAPARLQFATSLTPPVNWQDVNTGGATTYTVNPLNQFNVKMDPSQEPPPLGTKTGTGSGTVTLSNNVLIVDVTYSGLSVARSADHFHAPAGRGTNAAVVYDLGSITTGTTSGTINGNVTLLDTNPSYPGKNIAAQVQDLRNGLWYLNIHTAANPGGEIRGQVDPGVRFYRLISP